MKASGPAFLWKRAASGGPSRSFSEAFALVQGELARAAEGNEIFAAHLEILEDPMLSESVGEQLAAGLPEKEAVSAACSSVCSMFEAIDDEYLKARADDVRDVFGRIAAAMEGGDAQAPAELPQGCVIVAEELLPSDTARIDFSRVAGIICARGSTTSHVCIIAHSHGVPIRVGVSIDGISEGSLVEVDDPAVGGSGAIAALVRKYGRKLYVNAGSIDEIKAAMAAGADGIGLFRTEFLFMGRSSLPTREEHKELYLQALLECGGRPLTLRLLDAGGDKPLPCLHMDKEDNPFLGLRGIRLCLRHPELLQCQLGAAVDAARVLKGMHPEYFSAGEPPLRLMIPMVSTVEEVLEVRRLLPEDATELLRLGIMVETPAAVLSARTLAGVSDFFSVGSNDLTQYIMAADRGNPGVAGLYNPLSEAVLKAMRMVTAAAHSAGIPAGICGELASDPEAAQILVDTDFDSLSLAKL